MLTVQGEAFTGTNLGGFQGGVFQGLVMDGAVVGPGGTPVLDGPRALDSAGGWVQVLVALTPTVTVHGGFGTDDPDDADFFTVTRRESRLENTAISFGFQHKASAHISWGLEYRPPRHDVPHRRRQGRRPRQRRLHVHVLRSPPPLQPRSPPDVARMCYSGGEEQGMTKEVTLRQAGGSVSATLPKDMADRLRLAAGDRVLAVETDRGILLTLYDPDVERALAVAAKAAKKYRNALRELAR